MHKKAVKRLLQEPMSVTKCLNQGKMLGKEEMDRKWLEVMKNSWANSSVRGLQTRGHQMLTT